MKSKFYNVKWLETEECSNHVHKNTLPQLIQNVLNAIVVEVQKVKQKVAKTTQISSKNTVECGDVRLITGSQYSLLTQSSISLKKR